MVWGAYAAEFGLDAEQRALLTALDQPAIVALGVHPLVAFLARMQVDREGKLG